MKIALDYDETYTMDPALWDAFIEKALFRGHEVMIVTFRDPSIPIEAELQIPVFYTSYRAKRLVMEHKYGIKIDVWIDDSPEVIVEDSTWTEEERQRWKDENLSDWEPTK